MELKQINPFNHKSRLEQIAEPLKGSVSVPRSGVAAAAAAVGLAMGSAVLSSLRRRSEDE